MNQSKIISPLQKQNYFRDGFLVIKDFIEENMCNLLISRANQLIDQFDHSQIKHIFSAKNNDHLFNKDGSEGIKMRVRVSDTTSSR